MDYFNDVFTDFSGPAESNYPEAYEEVRQFSDFIKNNGSRWNSMRVSNY